MKNRENLFKGRRPQDVQFVFVNTDLEALLVPATIQDAMVTVDGVTLDGAWIPESYRDQVNKFIGFPRAYECAEVTYFDHSEDTCSFSFTDPDSGVLGKFHVFSRPTH